MLNEVLKIYEKWYLVMWELNKNNKNKSAVAASYKFLSLKENVNGSYIFHLILVGFLSFLIFFVKNRAIRGRFLLIGQNLNKRD